MKSLKYFPFLKENREAIINGLLFHIGKEDLKKAMLVIRNDGELEYAKCLVRDLSLSETIQKLVDFGLHALQVGPVIQRGQSDFFAERDLIDELYFSNQSKLLDEQRKRSEGF